MLFDIIVTVVIFAIIGWLVDTFVPMTDAVRRVVRALFVILIVLWVLAVLLGYAQPLGITARLF